MAKPEFTEARAAQIGDALGIDWDETPLEEFRLGLTVEFEHGLQDPQTNVTDDDPMKTGKIALAHLKEYPDYYTRLTAMEMEAEAFWKGRARIQSRVHNR